MATAATTSSCLQCRVGGTRWLLRSRLHVHQQFLTPSQHRSSPSTACRLPPAGCLAADMGRNVHHTTSSHAAGHPPNLAQIVARSLPESLPPPAGVHGCVVANAHKELREWADANMHDRWAPAACTVCAPPAATCAFLAAGFGLNHATQPQPSLCVGPWTYQSPLAPLLQDCCYLSHGQLVGCRPSPAAQEPSLLQDLHGHGGRPRRHLRGPAPLQVRTCLLLPASFTLQVGCCRRRARCGVSELTPLLLLVGCPLPASACLPQLPAKRGFPPCTFNAVSESFVHAPPNACAASPTPPKPTPCTGGTQWCSAWDTWRIGAMPQCPTMSPSAAAK